MCQCANWLRCHAERSLAHWHISISAHYNHDKNYEAVAKIDEQVIGRGSGHTKKAAEQQAAYNALKTLDNRS